MLKENERFDQLIKEDFSMDYLNHQMTFKEIFNLKDIDVDNKGIYYPTSKYCVGLMFRQWGDTLVIVCETSTTYRRC